MPRSKLTAAELIALEETRAAAKQKAERDQVALVRKALDKHINMLERQLGLLSDVDDACKALPAAREPRKGRVLSTDRRTAAAVGVFSDWHVEERVDPKVVQGLNEYNPTIAEHRIKRCFEGVEWLVKEQQATFDLVELYLFFIGDFITGYIHEELREGNFMSPLQAIMFWIDQVARELRRLLAVLPNIKLRLAFRFGNHGRTTLKTQIATAAANSFEWAAYHMLRRMFADEPRIVFQIDEGHHSIVQVYDYKIHLHHGDSIRSQGGIGGIDVPLNRAVAQWRNKYHSHLSIVGHFHRYQSGERLVTNGSLIGYGAYSDWLPSADPEPAQQAFFVIDKKRGKCKSTQIWCAE